MKIFKASDTLSKIIYARFERDALSIVNKMRLYPSVPLIGIRFDNAVIRFRKANSAKYGEYLKKGRRISAARRFAQGPAAVAIIFCLYEKSLMLILNP